LASWAGFVNLVQNTRSNARPVSRPAIQPPAISEAKCT
jgi:hypothetical protein